MIGLIDAACRFDEARGIKFETFAERRVRGAMIDALRRDAWPRGVRRQRRELEAAREQLRRELGAEPSLADLAARVGSDEARLGRTIVRINTIESTSPLSAGDNVDGASLPPALVPSEPQSPDRAYEEQEVRDRIRAAIASLPPRERKVIGLYYYGEATMKQIGAEIGVNESRVSQLHARAVQRLRKALGAECSAAGRDQPGGAVVSARCAGFAWRRPTAAAPASCCSTDAAGGHKPVAPRRRAVTPRARRSPRRAEPAHAASARADHAEAGLRMQRTLLLAVSASPAKAGPSSHGTTTASRRHSKQILQPERLREPAAAGVLEEPLRVGTRDISGHEQNAPRHRGVRYFELAVERGAVEPRHLQVADDQIVGPLASGVPALPHRRSARSTTKPASRERVGDGRAKRGFVLDHQHRLRRRRRRCVSVRSAVGEHRLERARLRPAAPRRTTRHGPAPTSRDAAAVLLDDGVGDGQTETGAFADIFGREKRIEDLRLHILRHARAVVIDFENHGIAIDVVPGAEDSVPRPLAPSIACSALMIRFSSTC